MTSIHDQIQDAAAKNAELLRGLAETDHAVPDLIEQDRYLSELRGLLTASDNQIKGLDAMRKKELKDHEKYRDSTMKRFMYKATGQKEKFSQKAEKEEREYFDALEKEHREQQTNSNLRGQIQEAEQHRSVLQASVDKHKDLQRQLDDLYHNLFAGPTPQFPDEDQKERQSEQALQAYHDARVTTETETRVTDLLAKAMGKLQASLGNMQEALRHSRYDMFGGGSVADMMERHALTRAGMNLSEVRMLIVQAQSVSPNVRDLPAVNINHGNLMSDVFFDNIFTDMAFHDEIHRGNREMERAYQSLKQQHAEAKDRLADAQAMLKANEQDLDITRKQLQLARQKVFENLSGGGSTDGGGGGPSTSADLTDDAAFEEVPKYSKEPPSLI